MSSEWNEISAIDSLLLIHWSCWYKQRPELKSFDVGVVVTETTTMTLADLFPKEGVFMDELAWQGLS